MPQAKDPKTGRFLPNYTQSENPEWVKQRLADYQKVYGAHDRAEMAASSAYQQGLTPQADELEDLRRQLASEVKKAAYYKNVADDYCAQAQASSNAWKTETAKRKQAELCNWVLLFLVAVDALRAVLAWYFQ